MSNTPNDPFDPHRGQGNPLTPEVVNASPGFGNQPAAKKRWPMILAIVLGLGFLSMIVCCGVAWYAVGQMGGMGMVFEPVKAELNRMPEVTEEVGQIESMSMNFSETVAEAEENPDFIVFDLECTNGPAKAAVKVADDGGVEEAILILPDGTRKEINTSLRGAAPVNEPLSFEVEEGTIEDATERELRELESSLEL
ncbi:hypothetical protein LOC71_02640 [Rhodopirellula sp. JC740]|uniref:Transmembrane protein n=1 Tax=Rhodopirellula halodulae TaxID=2894198 RepID=A0ABS8NC69_9BACT|nr:hypothetical protein [Rhodopirellula sp. JC740]MCC9641155.1 hypothetical protein [Rhodopirellula sp. JC740]